MFCKFFKEEAHRDNFFSDNIKFSLISNFTDCDDNLRRDIAEGCNFVHSSGWTSVPYERVITHDKRNNKLVGEFDEFFYILSLSYIQEDELQDKYDPVKNVTHFNIANLEELKKFHSHPISI